MTEGAAAARGMTGRIHVTEACDLVPSMDFDGAPTAS
jgi:hypothetical protein